MKLTTALMRLCFVLFQAKALWGQEKPKAVAGKYIIMSRSHIALTIEIIPDPSAMPAKKGSASFTCADGVKSGPYSFQGTLDQTWFNFPNLDPPLSSESDCQADILLDPWSATLEDAQRTAVLKFTTKPQFEFDKDVLPRRFGLRVILKGNYPVDMRKSADFEVFEVSSARAGLSNPCADPLISCTRIPDYRLQDLQGDGSDPARLGRVAVYFTGDRLTRSNPFLYIRNIVSNLDEEMLLKEAKAYEFPTAPKGKEQAFAFMSLTHQAGPRAKPGVLLDAKFDPLLFRTGRLLHGPNIKADLMWNTIKDLKTSDQVQFGWRGERFFRFAPERLDLQDPLLAGLRLTPAVYLETNRLRTQANFVASSTATLLFRGAYNPQAILTRSEYLKKVDEAGGSPVAVESIPVSTWGWSWNLEPGFEGGTALKDVTAKASDKSGAITVPSYGIFRIKTRSNFMLEFKSLSLETAAEFRYLTTQENVFRETSIDVLNAAGAPAKQTVLSVERMHGFKPSFEVKFRYRIDSLGHYSFESAFKNGALPPGFIYTNFYRSGLVVLF